MVDQRGLDIVLNMTADKRAAADTLASIHKIDQALSGAGKAGATVAKELDSISRKSRIDAIGSQFGKLAQEIKNTDRAAGLLAKKLKDIGASENEIKRATDAFANANVASGDTGTGRRRISAGLGQAAIALRNQSAIQIPGTGISTDAVAKMIALVANLPPVAFPVIAAITALGAGFVKLESDMQGAKKALDAATNANKTYYELLADGATTNEAKKRLEELANVQKFQQQELLNLQQAASGGFAAAVKEHGDATARLLYGLGQVSSADDEFAKRQEDLAKAIAANSTEQEGLTRALDSGTLAINDRVKAEAELAKIRSDAALGNSADVYNRELKRQQDSLLTSSQLFSKVTTAIQEQNAAQAALNELQARKAGGATGMEVDKQIEALKLQLGRSGADITKYYELIAQRKPIEDAIQNEKDLAAARLEVDKINDSVNKATADRTADLIAIQEKYKLSLSELKTAFDRAGLEAEIEKQQKIADLGTELRDKESAEKVKFEEDNLKIEADYQKRLKQIRSEFGRSEANAIQDRDAVALDAAQRKRDEELEEAKTTRDEQLKERDVQYKTELRGLRDNNKNRIAEINLAFQREAEQRARKYAYDQQALHDNNLREIALRQQAYANQLSELRKNLIANNAEWYAAGTAIVNYAKSVKNSIANLLNGGSSGVATGAVTPGNPINLGGIFGAGSGSTNGGSTGLGIRAPQAAGAVSSGVSVAVNGVGMSKVEVKRTIASEIDKIWTNNGW